jgi:hypothetical protein
MSHTGRTNIKRIRHRSHGYKHFVFLGVLLLLTVGFTVVGAILRPTDTGPPTLPTAGGQFSIFAIHLIIDFDSKPKENYNIDEDIDACLSLEFCRNDRMTIYFNSSQPLPGIAISVSTSTYCPFPPSVRAGPSQCETHYNPFSSGSGYIVLNFPPGFFFKQVGAYGSGIIPGLQLAANHVDDMARRPYLRQDLHLTAVDTPLQISMLEGPTPSATESRENDFVWDSRIGLGLSTSESFVTTNPYQLGVDSRNGFLSGIMFGVAGSVLIALVVELISPDRDIESTARSGKIESRRKEDPGLLESSLSPATESICTSSPSDTQNGTGSDHARPSESKLLIAAAGSALVVIVIDVIRSRFRRS